MNKTEVVRAVAEELKEKGHKVNKAVVQDTLTAIENVIDTVVENEDNVAICGLKVSTKKQKGRTGIIAMGDRKGQTYQTEDKIVPSVKFMPSKKKALSKND